MKEIAKILLKLNAVSLKPEDPFTWASGIKSPIYCDNRLTLSYPEERKMVEVAMAKAIKEEFEGVEMLMGTATAGIPHAAIVADYLNLPMGFVRGKAKDHGKENRIEGKLEKGMRVVVVEDLISTGGSSLEVVNHLRESGADVIGLISIFTYGMKKAEDAIKEADIKTISLSNYNELIEAAVEENYIDESTIGKLKAFMANPSDESWMSK